MRKKLRNFIRSIINKLNLSDKNQSEDDDSRDVFNPNRNVDNSGLSDSEKKKEFKVIL